MSRRFAALLLAVPAAALVLSGCAAGGAGSSSSGDAAKGIAIVASTNVYGDIAKTIGGDAVSVTSIIDSAAKDPHSYEATAQDQLAISKASLVIENGGGYDPFVDTLVDAAGADDLVVLNASELSGLLPGSAGSDHADDDHAGDEHTDEPGAEDTHSEDDHADGDHDHVEGFNEHVWYNIDAMDTLAHDIAHELGELDPDNASTFEDNYTAFAADLAGVTKAADAIAAAHTGEGVAITEPVPLYLLESAGLVNKTPAEFSEAIEEGTDVSPAVLADTLALFDGGGVSLLAYNDQTAGSETERVRQAAEDAGVPVVDFTETLPDGKTYIEWMTANLAAISDALA